jgi:hypothetical protein
MTDLQYWVFNAARRCAWVGDRRLELIRDFITTL